MLTFHYKDGLGLFPVVFHLHRRANGCARVELLSSRILQNKQNKINIKKNQKIQEKIIHKISNKIKILRLLFEQTLTLKMSCRGVAVVSKAGGPSRLTKRYTVLPATLETIWYKNRAKCVWNVIYYSCSITHSLISFI